MHQATEFMARATTQDRQASGSPLAQPLRELTGVTPATATLLERMGVVTVEDLIRHYPYRYDDLREITAIAGLRQLGTEQSGEQNVSGIIRQTKHVRLRGRVRSKTSAVIDDGTGLLEATWFGRPYLGAQLKAGMKLFVRGRVEATLTGARMAVVQHRVLQAGGDFAGELIPVYPQTAGLRNSVIRRLVTRELSRVLDDPNSIGDLDPLPDNVNAAHKFKDARWALRAIHAPSSPEEAAEARRRLVFEEFFLLAAQAAVRRAARASELSPDFAAAGSPESQAQFAKDLEDLFPFALTAAQRRAIAELTADMLRPAPMNRLLQGDVGSGKTAVAAAAILLAARAGYQSAFMAPTEILALQHFHKVGPVLRAAGVESALLVGGMKKQTRHDLLARLLRREIDLVVGTHALLTDDVEFGALGLAVIDEQHRFGVLQRAELRSKARGYTPHTLIMTATPIPRTLAQSLYADLDLSVIDELPPGRTAVATFVRAETDKPKIFAFVRKQVSTGRQAYVVCPAIDDSERALHSAVEQAESLRKGDLKGLRVALLHGKMTGKQKDEIMRLFGDGFIQVLISTTVVEVGVDVPNASVMVVLDADYYGLAQLHQLRGRVGRGASKSFCILVASERGETDTARLGILAATNDGFAIAEEDYRLRGSGDVAGTRQHGAAEFRLANLIRDLPVFEQAKKEADALVAADAGLERAENAKLKRILSSRERSQGLRFTS
jgi:ATP-dependent DNA helicase RecG